MLPACRTEGEGFSLPTFDLVPSEVEGFLEELWEFQSTFHACLARSEPRTHFFDSMVGPCRQLERKSIAPIALGVEGGTVCGMQRFRSDVHWDAEQMRWNDHQLVADTLGAAHGVLIFDETGFAKKGQHSVGVARQSCGPLGNVEHGQVGVFAAYASRQGSALVDKRFCWPESWFDDVYAARRSAGQVPKDLTFQTKPQLAAAMLQTIAHEGRLPFKYLVADGLYGKSPDFLEAIEACGGVTALVAIPAETRCWLQRPRTVAYTDRYKGEERSTRVGVDAVPEACTVAAVAAHLPASRGYRRTVSEGTKGPIEEAFARPRVTLCTEGLPERRVWLVLKRTVGPAPSYSYAIRTAPASIPLSTLVWLSGVRWAIEQCLAESKTELGMAHYEIRKYAGWHQHMLTTMLAHFFLWHLQLKLGKKSASADGITAPDLTGRGITLADVYYSRRPRVSRLDATAPSQRLSCA